MEKDNVNTAANNAVKLFEWLERKMSVAEGVDMMVMALAITIAKLADEDPDADLDEVADTICDMIKATVHVLQKMPANERT